MQYYLCKYITILLQNAILTFQKCNIIFPKKKKKKMSRPILEHFIWTRVGLSHSADYWRC